MPNMPNMQTGRGGAAHVLCAVLPLLGCASVHAELFTYQIHSKEDATLRVPFPSSAVGTYIKKPTPMFQMDCGLRGSDVSKDLFWRITVTPTGTLWHKRYGSPIPLSTGHVDQSMDDDACNGPGIPFGPTVPADVTITEVSLKLGTSMLLYNYSDKELRVAPRFSIHTINSAHAIILDINFMAKPRAICKLDLPPMADVPAVSLSQLQQTAPGNTLGEAVTPNVRVSCTGGGSAKVRLVPGRVENGCMGTGLSGVTVCIDDTTLLPGGTTISPDGDGSIKLPLRPGRGTGDATAGSYRATLTAVLEQN